MFEAIGLKKEESLYETWYGTTEGIYFTMEENDVEGVSCYSLVSDFNCSGLLGSVIDFVETAKRDNTDFIYSYSITSEKLIINFNKTDSDSKIEDFIKSLCSKLKSIEIKNTCVHCGRENNLFFYKHMKGISVMCETCGENLKNKIIVEQNVKNNYFLGFIGSLIGAIIGSALWVILGAVGWVASFAGYAIAFCSFFGYKKMKGKLNKTGVIINIITIVIGFLLANYLGLFIILKKEWACSFVDFVIITPALFATKDFLFAMLKDLLIGALFLVLGMSNTIKSSFNNAKQMEKISVEKLDYEYSESSETQMIESEI